MASIRILLDKCVGCSLCAKKCFAGAIKMRKRTPAELKACPE